MNIKEINEKEKGNYTEIEVYSPLDKYHSWNFHGDFITYVEDYTGLEEVARYSIMDENDYNNSILANCGTRFNEIYAEKDKILAILLRK